MAEKGAAIRTRCARLVYDREFAGIGLVLQPLVIAPVVHMALGDDADVYVGAGAQVIIDTCAVVISPSKFFAHAMVAMHG